MGRRRWRGGHVWLIGSIDEKAVFVVQNTFFNIGDGVIW
jgi:hypothetical protein